MTNFILFIPQIQYMQDTEAGSKPLEEIAITWAKGVEQRTFSFVASASQPFVAQVDDYFVDVFPYFYGKAQGSTEWKPIRHFWANINFPQAAFNTNIYFWWDWGTNPSLIDYPRLTFIATIRRFTPDYIFLPITSQKSARIISAPASANPGDKISVEIEWSTNLNNSWAAIALFEPPGYNSYRSYATIPQVRSAGSYRDTIEVPIKADNPQGVNRIYAAVANGGSWWAQEYREIQIGVKPEPEPTPTPTKTMGWLIGLGALGAVIYAIKKRR